jgi:hypothetical protein
MMWRVYWMSRIDRDCTVDHAMETCRLVRDARSQALPDMCSRRRSSRRQGWEPASGPGHLLSALNSAAGGSAGWQKGFSVVCFMRVLVYLPDTDRLVLSTSLTSLKVAVPFAPYTTVTVFSKGSKGGIIDVAS